MILLVIVKRELKEMNMVLVVQKIWTMMTIENVNVLQDSIPLQMVNVKNVSLDVLAVKTHKLVTIVKLTYS